MCRSYRFTHGACALRASRNSCISCAFCIQFSAIFITSSYYMDCSWSFLLYFFSKTRKNHPSPFFTWEPRNTILKTFLWFFSANISETCQKPFERFLTLLVKRFSNVSCCQPRFIDIIKNGYSKMKVVINLHRPMCYSRSLKFI